MKRLSCTECEIGSSQFNEMVSRMQDAAASKNWAYLEKTMLDSSNKIHMGRATHIDQLPQNTRDNVVYFPWFFKCNEDRYPSFKGKRDSRTE